LDPTRTIQLLGEALEGDEIAQGELLERLRPRLVMWATSRMSYDLKSKVDAEDIAQEVLLKLHKALPTFDGKGDRAFFGWVFKVAENHIRDEVDYHGAKKRQRTPTIRRSFSQTSPSMAADRTEQVQRVQQAILGLPDDYRQVIQLRRIEHQEVKEVAALMERSENAIRTLYCRALKALGAELRALEKNAATEGAQIRSEE